ncbi:MAG TPA: peptide MFS transporter [Pseudomonadota bacterium]|jgi:POT family proton-dependent oligopeptide transporter|nr:peptide MFS transporter [Pseudomonadota bacterium]HNF96353.1 peptide MFS transporter [Pseudomonadota bacterium]HNI59399.1 peptide MFS transporter [Pseudomonadota bacterium]HNK45079.1 peptide MFS transporter [Pseudomonadota bacterium]HNN49900.1 peptide MFS transporter [Pseudomonadota bacterium]
MASKHPRGLYVLFFTEMWERFGFYLMLALFTLYLTEHLRMTKEEASDLYGSYMFFVYLTPFFGGVLADRLLGYTRAILMGAALLGAGYLVFSIQNQTAFYAALFLMVIGNGLFKPNISTLVGNLYPTGDPRRDSAFSIFYMGINLGALFAGPVGEFMRTKFGWPLAFATAGIGMVFSFLIFAALRNWVTLGDTRSSVAAVLDVPLPAEYEDRPDPPEVERQRIIALTIMCLIVMFFWMAFHQNGTSLTYWANDNTDRVLSIGSWSMEIPPGVFQAFNSAFIIILTPVIVRLMGFLRARNIEPSTPAKIGIGMVLTAASYGIMVLASWAGGDHGKVHMLWLIACYFVITIAELFLSPMGLSMVTKLAPRRMTAMLMGVWFIATAIGNKLSGYLPARFWDRWSHAKFFTLLVITSLVAAGLLLSQFRRLKAAMPPEGPPDEDKKQADPEPAVAAVADAGY